MAIKQSASQKSASKAKPASTHPVRELSASETRILERLRKVCLALPEANERISHGEPTWFAGKGKVFAMFDAYHHGAVHLSVWLPQPDGAQETLIESDGDRFFRPPYVGANGWVGVVLDTKPDWQMVAELVRDAFVHVASKKLLAQL
jgi:predicted DNA-binding protein (MmcQ/YjbR family)